MKPRHILLGLVAAVPALCSGANIDRSTLTEVVNNVKIIEPASKKTTPAQVKEEFAAPNVLRTGPDSRAEMIAPDQTVTRVGQNTIFSFSRDSREIELQKGSILFQSPTGKGGGTIRTSAASAAVLGTTLIVVATKNGGFKVLLIEGSGRVRGPDGAVRTLNSGQMVYALPGGKLSGVFEFRLSQQVGASNLVSGFKKKLASTDKIQKAINKQEKDIKSGAAVDTGLIATGLPGIAYKVDVARDALKKQLGLENVAANRFVAAATTDAIIAQPQLDPARIFGAGDISALGLPGDSELTSLLTNSAGFVGANIIFQSPTVSLEPFQGLQAVNFFAAQDISLDQSVDFGAFPGFIGLIAGGTIRTPGSDPVAVRSASAALLLSAAGDTLVLGGLAVENTVGAVGVVGVDVSLQGIHLGGSAGVAATATNDLTITGVSGGATPPPLATLPNPADASFSSIVSRNVAILSAGRDLQLDSVAVLAPQITLNAGRDLKLTRVELNDGSLSPSDFNAPATTSSRQVRLTTENLASLRMVTFNSNDVLLSARTVALQNVNFRQGSHVVLESQKGTLAPNPNTGRPPVAGLVNFVNGVRYGTSPAESAVIQNGPAGGSTPSPNAPGIIIRPR